MADSTLAAQTGAFMQELTEAAGILEKVALVITLPSGTMEHYDEQAQRLFEQLSHVSGRVERIYTPVQEHEISEVIRRRLFSSIDTNAAGKVIQEFMDYAVKESMLPPGTEPSEYRKRFEASYPFLIQRKKGQICERLNGMPPQQEIHPVLSLKLVNNCEVSCFIFSTMANGLILQTNQTSTGYCKLGWKISPIQKSMNLRRQH